MTDGSILIVDDDQALRELVATHLISESMQVRQASSGAEAIRLMEHSLFDLLILDIMMEDLDGFEVLQWVRVNRTDLIVILLSAKWEVESKVHGFGIGADDYVTKPFSIFELVARVKAHLRRSCRAATDFIPDYLTCGSLTLDYASQTLHKGQHSISLTATETQLLYTLMKQSNRVMTKANLFESVWGHESFDDTSLTVYISHLRKKIEEDPHRPQYIQTIHGLGYRFNGRVAT